MLVVLVCGIYVALVKIFKRVTQPAEPTSSHEKEPENSSKVDVVHRTLPQLQHDVDNELSNRPLELDAAGYFVISTEKTEAASQIIAAYYTNTINKDGFACDPNTGEVIPCGKYERAPTHVFRGKSAKELSVRILEQGDEETRGYCTHLEHANYLGREFQKAEYSLLWSFQYMQD